MLLHINENPALCLPLSEIKEPLLQKLQFQVANLLQLLLQSAQCAVGEQTA